MDKKRFSVIGCWIGNFTCRSGYSISYGLPAGVIAYSSVCNSTHR